MVRLFSTFDCVFCRSVWLSFAFRLSDRPFFFLGRFFFFVILGLSFRWPLGARESGPRRFRSPQIPVLQVSRGVEPFQKTRINCLRNGTFRPDPGRVLFRFPPILVLAFEFLPVPAPSQSGSLPAPHPSCFFSMPVPAFSVFFSYAGFLLFWLCSILVSFDCVFFAFRLHIIMVVVLFPAV